MIVSTFRSPAASVRPPAARAAQPESPHQSGDSFTRDLAMGVLGVVPLVGGYLNFRESISAGIAGFPTESNVRFAGALANVAGTAAIVAGLATGNAVLSGMGQLGLGASGAAAAWYA